MVSLKLAMLGVGFALIGFVCLTPGPPFPPRGREQVQLDGIPIFAEDHLSVDDFLNQFVAKEKPVVVTLKQRPFWNLTAASEVCGSRNISLVSASTYYAITDLPGPVKVALSWVFTLFGHWFRVEDEMEKRKRVALNIYFDYLMQADSCPGSDFVIPYILRFLPMEARLVYEVFTRPLYMHDLPVKSVCPLHTEVVGEPIYLKTNAIHKIQGKHVVAEASRNPYVFAGPCQSSSYPMHQNTFPSDVIMLMVSGEKSFTAFAPNQAQHLDSMRVGGTQLFGADALNPDLYRTPQMVNAKGYKGKLTAGQMLYLPGSWIHQFENVAPGANVGLKYWYASEGTLGRPQ